MRKLLLLCIVVVLTVSCSTQNDNIDLSGEWMVKIDSLSQKVFLPGSLAENGVGYPPKDSATNVLSETYAYQGPAWYEREIVIPTSWEGHPVELYMERTKVSEVYINGKYLGMQHSVSTPHIYITDSLFKPGKNNIKIKVDNTKRLLPLGGSHAYSEHTQSNWNGILGDFYIRRLPDVHIRKVRIDTSPDGNCLVTVSLTNYKEAARHHLNLNIIEAGGKSVAKETTFITTPFGQSEHTLKIRIPEPRLWDEYTPHLYTFRVAVPEHDATCIRTGIRDFTTKGTQFNNNGRTVFLRGKNESGVFPHTGYPSMEANDWATYFSTIQSYGINHVRFHSWTPPNAAFEAADEAGVFLQPELPLWGTYHKTDSVLISYMKEEGNKILQEYGNHPSFAMYSLGNELEGDTTVMADVVSYLKNNDNRPLYALGTNNHYWNPQTHPLEDFFVAMRHGKVADDNSTDLRGSFSFADSNQGGIINCHTPNTLRDFSLAIRQMNKPVIGHETGQYQVYPNFDEIKKYTGVLRPLNFMVFRERLRQAGMEKQATDFLKASGALAALCYREEIEMALRTPHYGGFQLLDLQDYPGQGTALVGILDAFLESKGIIPVEEWKAFCNDVIPLARFSKYCWSADETFTAEIQVANYGIGDITNRTLSCALLTEDGRSLYTEEIESSAIPQGELTTLTSIRIPLKDIQEAKRLELRVSLGGTPYQNSWNIWVYPQYEDVKVAEGVIDGVTVTRDKDLFEQLTAAKSPVLYIPKEKDIREESVGGLFISDFWNSKVFKGVAESLGIEPSPGTLGLLIEDTQHGIFDYFPTGFYTNWQWWHIIKASRPIILDDMPSDFFPIVQVIDNFDRNHKLGLIYKLPDSRSLVCSSDLFACADEPEVKALFHSLVRYLLKFNNANQQLKLNKIPVVTSLTPLRTFSHALGKLFSRAWEKVLMPLGRKSHAREKKFPTHRTSLGNFVPIYFIVMKLYPFYNERLALKTECSK